MATCVKKLPATADPQGVLAALPVVCGQLLPADDTGTTESLPISLYYAASCCSQTSSRSL